MRRFISVSLLLAMIAFPVAALAEKVRVEVSVDGLSCPFCAYGLEKKLKKMEGVEDFVIDIEGGKVEITFGDGEHYSREKVEAAVKESGFTPRKIEVKK